MFTLMLFATCVPLMAVVAHLVLRDKHSEILADARGIALQTVIIIVVLLAIAGAIAGVLITRGQEATETLAAQDLGTAPAARASLYLNESRCVAANFRWDTGTDTCGVFSPAQANAASPTNSRQDKCVNSGHKWDPSQSAGSRCSAA